MSYYIGSPSWYGLNSVYSINVRHNHFDPRITRSSAFETLVCNRLRIYRSSDYHSAWFSRDQYGNPFWSCRSIDTNWQYDYYKASYRNRVTKHYSILSLAGNDPSRDRTCINSMDNANTWAVVLVNHPGCANGMLTQRAKSRALTPADASYVLALAFPRLPIAALIGFLFLMKSPKYRYGIGAAVICTPSSM